MSRVTRREWYERVNAAWPAQVPPLTAPEAVRAVKRLYRFAFRRTWQGPVVVSSGNRYGGIRWLRKRGAIASRALVVNPDRGWQELVHILSHYAERSGHNGAHARMELRMIKEVVRRGWLDGRLKDAPKPEPAPRNLAAERLARLIARRDGWLSKLGRAKRALAKVERSIRYYGRKGVAL